MDENRLASLLLEAIADGPWFKTFTVDHGFEIKILSNKLLFYKEDVIFSCTVEQEK